MLTPIVKNKGKVLYIQIADAIMDYIRKNGLKAGDRLPSERNMCQALNTCRNSLREALRYLETQKVINVRIGAGSYLTSDCSDRFISLHFTRLNFRETLEIKASLEIFLASKLMDTITEEQIRIMDGLVDAMANPEGKGEPFHEADLKFHKYLYSLSPNTTLRNMISDMLDMLDTYWIQIGGFPPSSWGIEYHRGIVDGLRRKDFACIQKSYLDMLESDIKLFSKNIQDAMRVGDDERQAE